MKKQSLAKAFFSAQKGGYNGSFDDYININYNGYCNTCNRCEIQPLSKTDWLAA